MVVFSKLLQNTTNYHTSVLLHLRVPIFCFVFSEKNCCNTYYIFGKILSSAIHYDICMNKTNLIYSTHNCTDTWDMWYTCVRITTCLSFFLYIKGREWALVYSDMSFIRMHTSAITETQLWKQQDPCVPPRTNTDGMYFEITVQLYKWHLYMWATYWYLLWKCIESLTTDSQI